MEAQSRPTWGEEINAIRSDLHAQMSAELEGDQDQQAVYMLKQKYGLIPPQFTPREKDIVFGRRHGKRNFSRNRNRQR
jgi:hypothetical protein